MRKEPSGWDLKKIGEMNSPAVWETFLVTPFGNNFSISLLKIFSSADGTGSFLLFTTETESR